MSDNERTCPACGVAYTEHLGLVGTCAKVQILREALERIAYDSERIYSRDIAVQALQRAGGGE